MATTSPFDAFSIINTPLLGEQVVVNNAQFVSLLWKLAFGDPGSISDVSSSNPLPVSVVNGVGGLVTQGNPPWVMTGLVGISSPIGQRTAANSLSVVLASDQTITISALLSANPFRSLDVNTTGQVAKNSPGKLLGYSIFNNANTYRYLKFYDKNSPPTSADTPIYTWPLPPAQTKERTIPGGLTFTTGIAIRATVNLADGDNTSPAANDVIVNLEIN